MYIYILARESWDIPFRKLGILYSIHNHPGLPYTIHGLQSIIVSFHTLVQNIQAMEQ
jgi:hypothetical protein